MTTTIGVISDTHIPEAQRELWPQVFDVFSEWNVDYIFHGGDVHDLKLLDKLETIAPIYCARGNGEDGSGGRSIQPEDPRVKYSWSVEVEELVVGLTHYVSTTQDGGQFTFEKSIERYFSERRPDVVIFGDTHVELITEVNGVLVVNPGSPTYPHNYDTTYGTLGRLVIEGSNASASIWQLTATGVEPFDWTTTPPWQRR